MLSVPEIKESVAWDDFKDNFLAYAHAAMSEDNVSTLDVAFRENLKLSRRPYRQSILS